MDSVHRRLNPLTGEWILVSPHRNNRPWSGATEAVSVEALPEHDPACPLCANNVRANGEQNPDFDHTFVFSNDFAALQKHSSARKNDNNLFISKEAKGLAKVICFSPAHNKTLAKMNVNEIEKVVMTWKQEYIELSQNFACVHIFENKGEIMGCSQPHPHGQIWAHDHYSTEIEKENERLLV